MVASIGELERRQGLWRRNGRRRRGQVLLAVEAVLGPPAGVTSRNRPRPLNIFNGLAAALAALMAVSVTAMVGVSPFVVRRAPPKATPVCGRMQPDRGRKFPERIFPI